MRRLKRAHQKYAREQAKRHKKFRQRAVAAGTAAAITLGAGVGINKALAHTPDIHELPVSQDADADLLANKEELAIGYRVFNADQNRSGIPDGVELAKRCVADVNELPMWDGQGDPPNEIYKISHAFFGVEQCDVCGQWIHMGGWEIVNPRLGVSYPDSSDPLEGSFLPDLALHYMEHGSFDCYGDIHQGRVDLSRLMAVLERPLPYEPNEHQLPVDGNDLDGDLLTNSEELEAGYNLHDPDQDNDLTPDGIELAKQCAAIIDELPWQKDALPSETYKWHGSQWGLETCDICGATVNMGPAGVVNPKLDLSVDCPLIAIHYMEHGSFSYTGDVHTGRIDVAALVRALEIPRRCGDLGTLYLPGDLNEDCKVNFADFAKFADKWLDSTDPSQD